MRVLGYFIIISAMAVCLIGFVYSMWYLERAINYKMSYESMVKKEIKSMVKKECLIH